MLIRWLAALFFAGGMAAGLGVGMTGTAHASDPTRPGEAWNEIFLPFGNGKGNTMCVDVPGGTTAPGAHGADPHVVLETSGADGPALCMAAADLSDNNQTPPVAVPCRGFGNVAEILELG